MSRRIIGAIVAALLILSVFTGCGSSNSGMTSETTAAAMSKSAVAVTTAADVQFGAVEGMSAEQAAPSGNGSDGNTQPTVAGASAADSIVGSGASSDVVNNAILNERKMIRSANVTVEVGSFDEAYSKINTFILGIGFIQETSINSEKIYVNNQQKLIKRGTIIIRVDKNKFDSVLNNIKGIGDVYNWNISGQDVTDKYIDTESRLRLLKLEESKLIEYLDKLTDLDQIYKMESQLTSVRQQIESLTGNLKKMSDLVELSTITINMNEKNPVQVEPVKPKTYGQRLVDNLKDSLKGVATFFGELLIIFVAALPVLIILGLIVLLVLFIYKRVPKRTYTPPVRQYPAQHDPASKDPTGQEPEQKAADDGNG